MKLLYGSKFKRAFKKQVRRNPQLQDGILQALELLKDDPFTPSLDTHKLHGQLDGCWACWVAYDCRIIFSFTNDLDAPNEQVLMLLDLGTHDDVY